MTRIHALSILVLLACAPLASAQPYAIDWYTIDGGGGISTGGQFEVNGTIGQHDAGSALTGGALELTGGFWAGVGGGGCNAADLAAPLGVLDFSDVIAFLTAFANMEPQADLAPPFGMFDFTDVVAFLTAFGAGCP